MRRIQRSTALVTALLCAVLFLALSGVGRAGDAAGPFKETVARFDKLRADPASVNRRDRWQALDTRLAGLAKAAKDQDLRAKILYYQAWTNEELAKRSVLDKDYEAAVALYARAATTAPGLGWADDALLRRATILIEVLKRPDDARADLERLLSGHPKKALASRAKSLLAELRQESPPPAKPQAKGSTPAPAKAPATASADHPAILESFAVTPTATGTRLTLTLDRETNYRYQVLEQARPGGEPVKRLYIDLDNTRTGPRLPSEKRYDSGNIARLRAGYFTPDTVRVVTELDSVQQYDVHPVTGPFRVVLELTAATKAATGKRPPEHRATVASRDDTGDSAVTDWLGNVFGRKRTADPGPAPSGTRGKVQADRETRQPATPPPPSREPSLNFKPGKAGRKQAGNLVEQLGLTVRTVMIDPGHGGKDPGAHGYGGLVEKDVNLRFAKILGAELKRRGLNVLYTRTTDTFIPLETRTDLANNKGADLFVSIHCNAHGDAGTSGLETYSLNLASSQEAVRVAARENASSKKTIGDLQAILTDLMLSAKTTESKDLAQYVQKRSMANLSGRTRDRGPHEAPFFVLIGANMPAVLVEMGYITNPAEAKRLASDAYLRALARGMVDGILSYKKKIERYATL